jgi:hypothetical protein
MTSIIIYDYREWQITPISHDTSELDYIAPVPAVFVPNEGMWLEYLIYLIEIHSS